MPFRRLSAFLLLAAASVAPWVAGANTTLPFGGWWLALPLAAAFASIVCDRIHVKIPLTIRWPAWVAVIFLLGCLAWWMVTPAPVFATAFAAEHWQFLKRTFPFVILSWPRTGHLFFFAAILLGFITAIELGRDETFRRNLRAIIGLNGIILALYALGIRWLGWTTPAWIQLAGDTERFNVWFFHHNGPGGCLILAWPLLLFHPSRRRNARSGIAVAAIFLIAGSALTLWHSTSPPAILAGLLFLGLSWQWLAAKNPAWPHFVRGAIVALFAGIFAWQARSIVEMNRVFPDGWISAAETLQTAPVRDAALRTAANRRGDRLVASPAPPRPAAWLTALRMTADHPLVGQGPGAWVTHAVLYSNDPLVNTFHQHRQFAHNDLFQTAAEWGGLGALAWLALWIGGFWSATRRDASGRFREMDVVLSLLGIAVHSTVHFPLQNPVLLLWTALLLGLAWSAVERHPTPEAHAA